MPQTVGSLANLNIDYYAYDEDFADVIDISTVTSNKLVTSNVYLNPNDEVEFVDVGNLAGVAVGTTYYVVQRDARDLHFPQH